MKAARILVLGVALAAGGAAAFLVGSDEEKKPGAPPVVVQQLPTVEVLIAKSDIGMGVAVSTEISPETGAGGFILPNDRVDVILSRRAGENDGGGASPTSGTILTNVRVPAIDQTVEEKNGQRVAVGKTATLEMSPRQAETLALRSLLDAGKAEINTVRYGVSANR